MFEHIKLSILVWLAYIGHDVCSAQNTCEFGEGTVSETYNLLADISSYTEFTWVRPSDDINVVICSPDCRPADTGYNATRNDTHSLLIIDSLEMSDVGVWKIQDATNDTDPASSVCNLTLSDDSTALTTPTPTLTSTDGADVSTTTSPLVETSTQNGTASTMTTPKSEEPDSELPLPLYLIIIIAVGAALLIAIIILIICIVRCRRKCEKYGVQDAEKSFKAPQTDAPPVQNLCDPHHFNGEPIKTVDEAEATKPKDDVDIPCEMVLSNGMLSQAPDPEEAGAVDETTLTESKEADLKENDNIDGSVCGRRDSGDEESDRGKDVITDTMMEPDETGPDQTRESEDGESNIPMDLSETGSNEATAIGSMFEGLEEPIEDMPQEQDASEESDLPLRAEDSNEEKSDTRRDEESDEDGNSPDDAVLDRLDESVLQQLSALGDSDSYDVAGAAEDGDPAVYVPERLGEAERVSDSKQ